MPCHRGRPRPRRCRGGPRNGRWPATTAGSTSTPGSPSRSFTPIQSTWLRACPHNRGRPTKVSLRPDASLSVDEGALAEHGREVLDPLANTRWRKGGMTWYESIAAITSIGALVTVSASIWMLRRQLLIMQAQNEHVLTSLRLSTEASIDGLYSTVTRAYIDFPELRAVFREDESTSTHPVELDEAMRLRANAIAEAISDTMDRTLELPDAGLNSITDSLSPWMVDSLRNSSFLREWLHNHGPRFDRPPEFGRPEEAQSCRLGRSRSVGRAWAPATRDSHAGPTRDPSPRGRAQAEGRGLRGTRSPALLVVQVARELQGRQPREEQDLVGVRVADAAAQRELRRDGIPVCFTMDAGPQVKAVCLPQARSDVAAALRDVPAYVVLRSANVAVSRSR